ncbi:hypothetical protein HDR63_03705 [bacterium]|nr:hypothetical protein [bacterium]
MTHIGLWATIDKIAQIHGTSPSGLARRCGFDATSFNKSKRWDEHGKPRWPSGKTLARVIETTHLSDEEFIRILSATERELSQQQKSE